MKIKIISFIEAIYLIYMFHFFRTTMDFSLAYNFEHSWLKHNNEAIKCRRICAFGRMAIIPYAILLIMRNYVNIPRIFIVVATLLAFSLSFMNTNATVYLIPIFLAEFLISYYDGYCF